MKTQAKALALLAVVAIAAVSGSLIFAMQSTAKADNNTAVASDSETTPVAVSQPDNNFTLNGGFMGFRGHGMMDRGFGGRALGRMGPIQVSADFMANITSIAKSDSDVQNLLNQGYNITSVRPIISTIIDGSGNVVTKASTANLMLQGNNGSRSFVVVDLTQAKVTKIVTITVIEINK